MKILQSILGGLGTVREIKPLYLQLLNHNDLIHHQNFKTEGTHEENSPIREGILYVVEFELAFNNDCKSVMIQKKINKYHLILFSVP